LCLSGGGIRSAAFCLGVLQALARRRLLRAFYYLSTVSGGGYIAAWLTRCIAARDPAKECTVTAVEEEVLAHVGQREPPELERLRRYTNFLTPRSGLASDDTWAGIMLWLRNTLVNWAVFLPLMLATAAVPVAYAAIVCALNSNGMPARVIAIMLGVIGLLCLFISVHNVCMGLPSHQFPDEKLGRDTRDKYGWTGEDVFRRITVWTLAWTFLASCSLTPYLSLPPAVGPTLAAFWSPIGSNGAAFAWPMAIVPTGYFVICLTAYGSAWVAQPKHDPHRHAFHTNFGHWTASCAVSAGMIMLGAWLARHGPVLLVAIAGPVWIMSAELLRSTVYVALRRGSLRSDLDREWLARLSGSKLRLVLGYGVAASATLFLPTLVLDRNHAVVGAIASLAGFFSGPVAALLGKAASSEFTYGIKTANKGRVGKEWVIGGAIILFITALLMLLGRLVAEIMTAITVPLGDSPRSFWLLCLVALLLVGLAGLLAWRIDFAVNLNRFSMHAVYRNRLIRAFLGTSRDNDQRRPDRYTGFDPTDNVRLSDTFTERSPKALFPVINVTLNATTGGSTARAQRKGEPFTMTPLHCGSAALNRDQQDVAFGAYVPTPLFASGDKETGPDDLQKGITLGTAITLSGAAASPNMGYHSSFFTAFVMALFNVRLGAWLPNPGWAGSDGRGLDEETAKQSGPIHAIPTMLEELTGLSNDRGRYTYLSDGGHFDNLGLYEMLRRQCRLIVVIDAGQDEHYAYFDLSHALQLASIDLGIRVRFHPAIKVGERILLPHGAFARIIYPAASSDQPEKSGELLYIKPWLPPDAPVELTAFKQVKSSFPHETTANQFFTESDFESYRKLGEYLASTILDQAGNNCAPGLDGLFTALRELPKPAPEALPSDHAA
jgi:hypothetical protein